MNKLLQFLTKSPSRKALFEKTSLESVAKQNTPKPIFFSLDRSPHRDLQEYHREITQYSSCPVCIRQKDYFIAEGSPVAVDNTVASTGNPASDGDAAYIDKGKSRLRPEHTCNDCGFPTHCSEDHLAADEVHKKEVCQMLRQWNEDEHDLRSGRKFWEMNFPGLQPKEALLNFSSWPYIFVSRKFPKQLYTSPIAQRHVSRLLTYPYTIASMLSNPWVYQQSDKIVTDLGWHILSRLSHAVDVANKAAMKDYHHSKGSKRKIKFTEEPTAPTLTSDPFRVFILGARVESQLPVNVWEQLSNTFPGVPFRLHFIGPEASVPKLEMTTSVNPFQKRAHIVPATRIHRKPITSRVTVEEAETTVSSYVIPVSVNLRLEFIKAKYEQVHDTFGPFNTSRDIFVLFNSGLAHTRNEWKPALNEILKTRCLTIFTSFNKNEQEEDVKAVKEDYDGDYDVVMRPTFNKFSSMRPDIPADCVHDPEKWWYTNWGMFAVRGIGNEVGDKRDDFYVEDAEKGIFGW